MKTTRYLLQIFVGCLASGVTWGQVGTMPIPQADTAILDTAVEIVPAAGGAQTQYIYRYTVTNPATSNDPLYRFSVDISAPGRDFRRPTLQTMPKQGGARTRLMQEEVDLLYPFFGRQGEGVVSIGLECPSGWTGGLRKDATVVCYAANDTPLIDPGESLSGFAIYSRFPPMLRDVDVRAFWTVVVDSHDDEATIDKEAAFNVLESLRRPQRALAPTYVFPNQAEHYSLFEQDLAEMISLGWIPNATLATELSAIIDQAGELFESGQGITAKLRLNDALTELAAASDSDIRPDALTHLTVSIDSIQEFGSNSLPFGALDSHYRVSPRQIELPVGTTATIEAFVYRLNVFDFETGIVEEPLANRNVYFGCDDFAAPDPEVDPCPNMPNPDNRVAVLTDTDGIARFRFAGNVAGRDYVEICGDSFCETDVGPAIVDWASDVDLVIDAFSPPLIKAQTGDLITFTDRTANTGDGSGEASVTRFYISESDHVGPATAIVVGERSVPALDGGAVSEQLDMQLPLPDGFSLGVHNLIACADANQVVAESDETNNCSNIDLEGHEFIAIPVADFEDLTVVTVNDITVDEGDAGRAVAFVDVELSQRDPDSDIVVAFELGDGTATVGDYRDASGMVTFPAGVGPQTQQIEIAAIGDTEPEDDEFFVVSLAKLSGEFVFLERDAEVTILDDDIAAVLDCSTAVVAPSLLWPPNHKFRTIHIDNVVDERGNEAQVVVQQILQDELVEGEGDGDTQPDATINETGQVQVRAERSGLEDGRIYEITFSATSAAGAACTGSVMVGVPHDKGQGSVPIDSQVRYNSTVVLE